MMLDTTEDRARLGAALRKFRLESGYSQNQLSNILGIERSTYTYYETGKTVPVVFDLMRIADLYGISLDRLTGFHFDTESGLALHEPRKLPKRRENEQPPETLQDLTADERQLLAYYRSATAEERENMLKLFYDSRREVHRRITK